ncbi:uncharacterized protein METZ01_LOCUS24240 [marine metagenome]|uniref:Uncharacterized protein n=1 Tax=marine metagenome TaxID=408172 RepID=A0A381PWE3_9ZZZZ
MEMPSDRLRMKPVASRPVEFVGIITLIW